MQWLDAEALRSSCGARTRSGRPCRNPPVTNKVRCRMHGGAHGSGAQPGNTNALKHGRYSAEAAFERHGFRELMRTVHQLDGDYAKRG
ncbi:MAG: hypothetical protein CVU73_14520 [Deltaproteobacteria bacterium HGW-Deltaproteobacteria-8]|nr:MAG: hypothetical protein CVU73_14520 [Deltaproteobacteria bacterium HGW-Deltaproteobacteria-8]